MPPIGGNSGASGPRSLPISARRLHRRQRGLARRLLDADSVYGPGRGDDDHRLLDAGANGTGGPLLVTLVLGALAAADTARGRMMMRYWEIVGPPPAELGGHWEYVLRHLRLCMRTPEQ